MTVGTWILPSNPLGGAAVQLDRCRYHPKERPQRAGPGERHGAGGAEEGLPRLGGLLRDMCSRGMIAYAPGTGKEFVPCFDVEFVDRRTARQEVIRRYFQTFGPATFTDCAYFTGFRQREVAELVEQAGLP